MTAISPSICAPWLVSANGPPAALNGGYVHPSTIDGNHAK